MRKRDELTNPQSCLNKATDNEMLFVLMARDWAAPAAVLAWIDERLRLGLNKTDDPKIIEARLWAKIVLSEQCPRLAKRD